MTATVPQALTKEQNLTEQEVNQARLFLRQTQNSVIGATKGLSEAQWKFKPAADRWAIVEILDHILMVQERVLGPVLGELANAPAPPPGVDYQTVDAIVIHYFPSRLNQFPSPVPTRPMDQIVPAELAERLAANYAQFNACLESTPGLRQHAVAAPPLKAVSKGAYEVMDGYQWILAAAAHTERHVKQMLEVKADPRFPG